LIDNFTPESFGKDIYKFKVIDYEKHIFDWIVSYNAQEYTKVTIKDS
jgi:hypothetical protein